jgi:spermidine synthase
MLGDGKIRKGFVQTSGKGKLKKTLEPQAAQITQAFEPGQLSGGYHWLLRGTVLIGGASVMIVEILGSRVLAPSFGTTLHVWSALITVTLAALAIGYAVGGRVADRRPGLPSLMVVMAVAAGVLLLSDLMTKPVLKAAYGAGMVGGTFVAATLLFLPCLFLLGMVSPMAVRAAADQKQLGTSVGNLYALSTVGSVAGSLSVSLLLIPNMTVHSAILATVVALTLPPLVYLFFHARRLQMVLFLLVVIFASVATKGLGEEADREILYKNISYPVTARVPSSYGDLVVSDYRGVRYLFLNGVQQGSMIGDVSFAKYAYGLGRLSTARGIPKKMLIWGLGAGVYARAMAEAGVEVTVIEIDPMSEQVARDHFGLPATVRVIIGDARTESVRLQRQKESFDVIVLDAFSGDTPPFHLLTREAFGTLRDLAPNGLIIANIVGGLAGEEARVVTSVQRTMESIFGPTRVFSPNWLLFGKPAGFVSTMFLVSGSLPDEPAPFPLKVSAEVRREKYVESVFASELTLPKENAVILTDDFAPLEAWSDAAVKAMRF